jgi:N-acetylmuramate 1-kinase
MATLSLYAADDAATRQLGQDLALVLRPGDCVALYGDLGAGKSTLARAFIRGMALDADLDVPSPTFTLVQQYDLRHTVFHFDLYRLGDESELAELGFEEAMDTGICLVEWPEKAGDCLPKTAISIHIVHEGSGRRLTLSAEGKTFERVQHGLAIRQFLTENGFGDAGRLHFSGDASAMRSYEQIITADGQSMILMDSQPMQLGAILRDGKTYGQIVHLASDIYPFVAIGNWLQSVGLRVPRPLAADLPKGLLLLEDMGRDGVLDDGGLPIAERYMAAIEALAHLHRQIPQAEIVVTPDRTHAVARFDREAMKTEADLLLDWHHPYQFGVAADPAFRDEYHTIWDALIDRLERSENRLLLRDFHSPNILWQQQASGIARIGIIDFQDAMIGPSAYDVASLVQDARVTIPAELGQAMLSHYLDLRAGDRDFDRDDFLEAHAIMAAQRNCKLVGIWVRLMLRDNKPGYMQHMPRTLTYLRAACAHPTLNPLRDWCIRAGVLSSESTC